MTVWTDPSYAERQKASIGSGQATTLPMTEEQIARAQTPKAIGFPIPEPPAKPARKRKPKPKLEAST